MRQWVARFQFEGCEPAYFGTVVADSEMMAEQAAFAAWRRVFPTEPPRVFTMVPGAIRLELEDSE